MVIQILLLLLLVFAIWYFLNKYELSGLSYRTEAGLILHCGIIALAVGAYMRKTLVAFTETYYDFIGGFVPMYVRAKTPEYMTFYAGIGIFLLLLIFMRMTGCDWKRAGRERDMQRIIFYSLIPAAVMAGQMFICKNVFTAVFPAAVSAAFGGIVLIFFRSLLNKTEADIPFVVLGSFYLLAASLYCAGLADNYFNINILSIVAVICFAAAFYWSLKSGKWYCLLIAAQLGLPLGYLHLAGVRFRLADGTLFQPGYNMLPGIMIAVLIAGSYVSILRKLKRKPESFADYVSGFALLAFISCFCAAAAAWPAVSGDDYHNGEVFLPWYLLLEQGKLPYLGYIPSRGAINYVPGFLIWLFKGHDFSLINDMLKWADLPVYALLFMMLRRQCGLITAFIGTVAITGLSPNMQAGIVFGLFLWYCLSSEKFEDKPIRFLVMYGLLSIAGAFYSLTDTLVVSVSMLPLVIYMIVKAWNTERRSLLVAGGSVLAVGAVLAVIPVVRLTAEELLKILFEQSKAYTAGHCLPYMPELNPTPATQGVLWSLFRYGFIGFCALFAATLIFWPERFRKDVRKYCAFSALPVLMVLMIQRAGGRIDPDNYSRIYTLSSLIWCCVIPLWYKQFIKQKRIWHGLFLILWLLGVGIYGKQLLCLVNLEDKYKCEINAPENVVDPEQAGLCNLGSSVVMVPEHFKHHLAIKSFRESVLKPGETIWDLTNNSMLYGYHNLPLAMRYPAYFYIAPPDLCREIAGEVAENLPVLALIDGRPIEFGEGKLPFRTYPLYKLLLDNYRVFKDVNGKTWMIRKGEEKRLENNPLVKAGSLDDIEVLCKALCDDTLFGYPLSWGLSIDTLLPKLTPAGAVNLKLAIYRDYSIWFPISGLSGDFLHLRFDRPVPTGSVRVVWEDEFGGKGRFYNELRAQSDEFLIPMSASPNWYLSRSRNNLQILFPDKPYPYPQIVECSFWNRK